MKQGNYWKSLSASLLLIGFLVQGCEEAVDGPLPLLGPYKVNDTIIDGMLKTDTTFTTVRPFSFIDQDGNEVSEVTTNGKIYVADFFFTSCPTICPKMKQQMLRLYNDFEENDEVIFLSHSIDPKRDSVARLHDYAEKLGITSDRWHLMTGERDDIYSMAKHYMIAAQEDKLAPGGYAHSGAFLLVDKNRQIRGIYDGTSPEEVDQLKLDIQKLLSDEAQP
jgi:protein SCO1